MPEKRPGKIKVVGARVHNLKNIDVDIPLNRIVGVAAGNPAEIKSCKESITGQYI